MSLTFYDPFKIYQFGDPELAERTNIQFVTDEVQDYATIKKQNAGRGFIDPEFPHNETTIGDRGVDTANASASSAGSIVWLRLKDALKRYKVRFGNGSNSYPKDSYKAVFCSGSFGDTMCRGDIQQGSLGDCYFVASLAALTINKEALEWAVPADNMDDQDAGVYHYKFFQDGVAVDVVVDDWIPFLHLGKNIITPYGSSFTVAGNEIEQWVVLAEKAYAKLLGGYANMSQGGTGFDALRQLTGGMVEIYNLKEKSEEVPHDMLEQLGQALGKNSLVALSCRSSRRGRNNQKLPDPKLDAVDLVYDHAYTISKVDTIKFKQGLRTYDLSMVCVRNPHGCGGKEWSGAFSDKDGNWQNVSEADKKRIGFQDKDDGEFWIRYEDLLEYFTRIDSVSFVNESEIKPPFVYESYDGKFRGIQQAITHELETVGTDKDPDGNGFIFMDITFKPNTRGYGIKLFRAEYDYSNCPSQYLETVKQFHAKNGINAAGTVGSYRIENPEIKPIEGTKTNTGTSAFFAYKIPAGKYQLELRDHSTNPFTLRLYYTKAD